MDTTAKLSRFKKPLDAYEHCQVEIDAWYPRWQAALKAGNIVELRQLADRFRHRVLAIYPKADYKGSWAMISAGFGYSLSELSEFERSCELMDEARALYHEALPDCAPEWHKSLRASWLHGWASILLRSAEVDGDTRHLLEARSTCTEACSYWSTPDKQWESTLSAVLRRLAERNPCEETIDAALMVIGDIPNNHDATTGSLSWAQRQTSSAAVLLLRSELTSSKHDLENARRTINEVIANYTLNPHGFWIRPSHVADVTGLNARIERRMN